MLLTFTFTINPETKEGVTSGNISASQALTILQNIVVTQAIEARMKQEAESKKRIEDEGVAVELPSK